MVNAVAADDELDQAENPELPQQQQLEATKQDQTATDNEAAVVKETNSRVEAIIRKKLGRGFSEDDFDEEQFDLLLLEGLDLAGELTLDDKAFLERFCKAKILNLSYCQLRSLKNLPVIPTLETLNVSDNNLSGEDLHIINTTYKRLKVLNLSNNAIRNLDNVALLGKVQTLQLLDLSANPITDINNYRQNLFEKLPNLEALDGYNAEGSECSYGEGDNTRFDNDDF